MPEDLRFNLDGEDGGKIRRILKRMAGAAYTAAMDEFGDYKVSRTVRSFPRTPAGVASAPGGPPAVQEGHLRASITYRLLGRVLRVGTNLVYAALLQFGGVIRPKRARALTVPIAPEARGRRARDFSDTFILRRRSDDAETVGIIMQNLGGGKVRPLFALRTSVTVEPRPFLGWDERDKRKLLGILERHWSAQS